MQVQSLRRLTLSGRLFIVFSLYNNVYIYLLIYYTSCYT